LGGGNPLPFSFLERKTAMQVLHGLDDAAKMLGGISVWTLRKHISQGAIATTRLGKRVFLSSEEVERIQREGLPSLKGSRNRNPSTSNGTNSDSSRVEQEPCPKK
jgi:hypothetical protein